MGSMPRDHQHNPDPNVTPRGSITNLLAAIRQCRPTSERERRLPGIGDADSCVLTAARRRSCRV